MTDITARQTIAILDMLRTYQGGITALDALREAGCFRLAARIADLRAAGYPIESRMVTVNGKRIARYTLEGFGL